MEEGRREDSREGREELLYNWLSGVVNATWLNFSQNNELIFGMISSAKGNVNRLFSLLWAT